MSRVEAVTMLSEAGAGQLPGQAAAEGYQAARKAEEPRR